MENPKVEFEIIWLGLNMLPACMQKGVLEAGLDEAGRGCLAGPVVAAAVILPDDYQHPLLNDSKKLSYSKRISLRDEIIRHALAWNVATVEAEVIDRINILQASIHAMHLSIEKLSVVPGHLLIDGNYFKPFGNIPHRTVVKGDATYANIAAASILAKTTRDELMESYHREFPVYQWNTNKGYPTLEHREAISMFGTSPLHRLSFRLLPSQLTLEI